ncbi:multidrug resistance-associated protein 4-like [Actinia tenebrosa]|uniref:Multidrug resistance-associated protein 4-like n=1 Tax=Actinia tenebrosa TaxID=6105 RepID=A0A6P8I9P4_ACTTE|nr:multidrug resistance-associated protein 4-like [Actinia tenebrosa]
MPYSKQKSSITLGIYGGMVAGATIIVAIRILCLFLTFIRSSEMLHDKMLIAILKSPVFFFDTNPVGRMMNRFSKDISTLDDLLPFQFVLSIESFFQYFGVVTLTCIVNPWFVLVIAPTVFLFLIICHLYLKTARELSRMEAINCSPLYEHVSETMKGLEVIHSLEKENSSLEKLHEKQDLYTRSLSLEIATSRWVSLYVDLLSSAFLTTIGFGTLFLSLDPASTGMLMTFIISTVRISSRSIRGATVVESQMVSVERIQSYTKLSSEPGYDRQAEVPTNWPSQGAISLRGVSLYYIDGGPSILKDINIDVQAQEKIGIAGRTGAGKSSLIAALSRMPDPEGQVLVDGIDLGTINVQDARRAMAVITQEPFLFKGSLKNNLDPFDQFTEDEIWSTLKAVQLIECVQKLDGLLEHSFGEGGSGFSAGERQMSCLARALLQRRKILVLDEATANVDYNTDQRLQHVIRNTFSSCTVLTIAHRLNTILDYDRVVVLDGGHVVENDRPDVLATRSNGVFAKLLRDHDGQVLP